MAQTYAVHSTLYRYNRRATAQQKYDLYVNTLQWCEYKNGEQQYLKQSTKLRNMWKSGGLVGWRKSPR